MTDKTIVKKSRVALVKGQDRFTNIRKALDLIEGDIDLGSKRRILIKPNFVSVNSQLAATHVDAVRGVLEFLRKRTEAEIIIGESAACGTTLEGFTNYGYLELTDRYDVRLIDLSEHEYFPVKAYDRKLNLMHLHVSRITTDCDYRISVCPLKTHNEVIVTLSLKNIAVGSLQHKSAIHQGYQAINLNLFRLAHVIAPHLSVIDGFEAMEGNGPGSGTAVNLGLGMAGTDFLSVDAMAAKIMGFSIDKIGYLYYCKIKGLGIADMDDIEILDDSIETFMGRPFKPHHAYRQQLDWHIPSEDAYIISDET